MLLVPEVFALFKGVWHASFIKKGKTSDFPSAGAFIAVSRASNKSICIQDKDIEIKIIDKL